MVLFQILGDVGQFAVFGALGDMLSYILAFSSPLAGIFAAILVYKIYKKDEPKVGRLLKIVFTLIAIGYVLWGFAEGWWTYLYYGLGNINVVTSADIFWVAGYFVVFAGFIYFASQMYKIHGGLKKGLVTTGIVTIVSAAVLFYLIGSLILGFQEGESAIEIFLDYFYPIASAVLIISSIAIYQFYKEAKAVGTTLLLVALSILAYFVGDMFFTYYSWNEIYGVPGLISDVSYIIGDIVAIFAFGKLAFSKKNSE